jgi:CheY-like chemotaxis protein
MASVGNPATILLVDDDGALRRFARRILMQKGFHVIGTYDGAEALQDAYAQPVDLLLTDPIPIARQEWTCEVACLRPR